MKTAFGYIRRSSHKQKDNYSVEFQKAQIQEFATRKGFIVPDEFIFIEDLTSAYNIRASHRKELMRMRNIMVETNIPRVIFYEESRMDRTAYSFVLDFYRPLLEKLSNIEVYTTKSEEPFNPEEVQTQMILLLARHESEIKSDRAIGSLIDVLEKEDKIRPGATVPYGYDLVNQKLIANEKAEIVTFIYFLQSWGTSMGKIASILNEAEIPSPKGSLWRPSTIEKILKNPIYSGVLKWDIRKDKETKSYEFKDFTESIVDRFLLQLNENNIKLQSNYGRLDTPFLFLNKLFCRHCQDKLQTQNGSTTRNGKKYYYHYYVCKNCNYKLDISELHKSSLPKILKHVHEIALCEETRSSTIEFLNKVEQALDENITNLKGHLDIYSSRGCIAKEQGDRVLEQMIEKLQSQTLLSLHSLQDSRHILDELNESVHSNLFFERFRQILQSQLGESEQRLIILYFIDKVLVSHEQPLQVIYRQNVFESFELLPAGQNTET